jgi:hypothetical protein
LFEPFRFSHPLQLALRDQESTHTYKYTTSHT